MNNKFQRCTRCVMDNASNNRILFDENGVCNYCKKAETELHNNYFPDARGEQLFNELCNKLKSEGKNKKYDCLMGVSGGLDSSYLLMLCAQKGLRILAVHIDDGFDTELAKCNIDKLCKKANVELRHIKPDALQFNDLNAAYIRAGVCNLAVPQDNVLFANLYKYAIDNGIHYFLSGHNLALESILEDGETYSCYDTKNIRDIHRKYGREKIDRIELISYFKMKVVLKFYGIHTIRPLNYIDYNKEHAIAELNEYCGYQYYEAKHLENELTKFIQLFWFCKKFGIDKRKSHLSSLIMSNQITREEALLELERPVYNDEDMERTINNILSKLQISEKEFKIIMSSPNRSHYDYKTSIIYNAIKTLKRKRDNR